MAVKKVSCHICRCFSKSGLINFSRKEVEIVTPELGSNTTQEDDQVPVCLRCLEELRPALADRDRIFLELETLPTGNGNAVGGERFRVSAKYKSTATIADGGSSSSVPREVKKHARVLSVRNNTFGTPRNLAKRTLFAMDSQLSQENTPPHPSQSSRLVPSSSSSLKRRRKAFPNLLTPQPVPANNIPPSLCPDAVEDDPAMYEHWLKARAEGDSRSFTRGTDIGYGIRHAYKKPHPPGCAPQLEPRHPNDILTAVGGATFGLYRNDVILSLIQSLPCLVCKKGSLSVQDRGTVQEGVRFVIALKCRSPHCGEELRFGRSGLDVVNPADTRSPLVSNVLTAVSMIMRGNSFTRVKVTTACTGAGAGLSETAAYEILKGVGIAKLVVEANKKDCSDSLDAAIALHLKKCSSIALAKGISLEEVLEQNPLVLSYDGAYGHCRNTSVGYGDLIAHIGEKMAGFVTRFPVVGFVVKTKNRAAPGSGFMEAGSSQVQLDGDDEQAPDLFSIGSHGSGSSKTMEHAAFLEIMESVQRVCSEKKVVLRMVLDGDLSLGAAALLFASISDVVLDRRHFFNTFRKKLVKSLGGSKPAKSVHELCDRVQAHFRWCCYIGRSENWTEQELDKQVAQCISHWNDEHSNCHKESLYHRSGQGDAFKVGQKVSLTHLESAGLQDLRDAIKKALKREQYQKILGDGDSNINESFHIHQCFHGASNFKSGNDYVYAELRRHSACLTWNRGFEYTWKLVLTLVFGDRNVFSEVDWENVRAVDREIAADRMSQAKQEQKKHVLRKRTADENADRLRPFDAAFSTNLIPYGEVGTLLPSVVQDSGLQKLYAHFRVRRCDEGMYFASEKCVACRIALPLLGREGFCGLCFARRRLIQRGWTVGAGHIRVPGGGHASGN